MFSENKINEPEIKHPTPNLYHIHCVIEESKAGSDDAARGYVKEINHKTFLDAIDEIKHANVDQLAHLKLLLNFVEEYYAICDRLSVKYRQQAKDSLTHDLKRVILQTEKKVGA